MKAERSIDAGVSRVAPGLAIARLAAPVNVTAATALPGGRFAAGLGDGRLAVVRTDGAAPEIELLSAHDTAVTGLAAGDGILATTGQDGRLLRWTIGRDGAATAPTVVAETGGRWLASPAIGGGILAATCGRAALLFPLGDGSPLAGPLVLDRHPSSISAVAVSPDGTRLAAAHYGGASVWTIADPAAPLSLDWKGSHVSLTWSPDGRFLVTGTQERELHAWDLVTGRDFRMGGYAAKVVSFAWTAAPLRLIAAGADVATAWAFGSGPGATPPLEIGYSRDGIVTRVAAHPTRPMMACGYSTGAVLVGGLAKGEALIARIADGAPVSALSWSPDGDTLLAATRLGRLDVVSTGTVTVR